MEGAAAGEKTIPRNALGDSARTPLKRAKVPAGVAAARKAQQAATQSARLTERRMTACCAWSKSAPDDQDQASALHWRPAVQPLTLWFALCTAWKVSVTVADPPCSAFGASVGSA